MWLIIESMETFEKPAQSGKMMEWMQLKGTKLGFGDEPDQPYERTFAAFKPEVQQLMNDFSVGDKVAIKFDTGKFKNILSVELLNKGNGGTTVPPVPSSGATKAAAAANRVASPPANQDAIHRSVALKAAADLLSGVVSGAGNFTKLLKKGATLESITDLTLTTAEQMVKFVRGEWKGTVEVDESGLEEPADPLDDEFPPEDKA